jgi:DNA-binding transcriptional regulator LsrR (DeoR family)
MADMRDEYDVLRQTYTVLMLHFIEGMKQSEIAKRLNLSTSKVNRLIASGQKAGMVKITIESPFQRLMDLEKDLTRAFQLNQAIVTPTVSDNPETTLQQVGRAAANHLLETLHSDDVIAITGGRAISALVDNLAPEQAYDIRVVPLTGGVQGKYYTDVNHLAMQFAEKLGGAVSLVHAPLFAETQAQRDVLMAMASIRDVFDLARRASVAVVGVGGVEASGSGYYDSIPDADQQGFRDRHVAGEFIAHLIQADGSLADVPLNSRVVALNPGDLAACPRVIGVASGAQKIGPLRAALAGHYLHSLVVDETTAQGLLDLERS